MMSISGRFAHTLAHVTAAAAIAVGALVTLSTTASTAGTEADGPHYQEPLVGSCRNYTAAQSAEESNSSPVVSCSTTKTGLVLAAPQLPSSLTWNSSVDSISAAMKKACYPALSKKLGRTAAMQQLSAYSISWFIPTQEQRDHGARWMRCDLTLPAGTGIQRLPRTTTPVLPSPLTISVRRCLTGTNHLRTTCNKAHNYRATGTFVISGTTFPGGAAVQSKAQQRCPRLVSTRAWYWTGPAKSSWQAGNHSVVCYSKRNN